jgi:mRNA-degrading endonuclease toxin of MazEF toxin-antitoxin module
MPAGRGEITVAYLITTIRHLSVEVPLTPAEGVPMNCVVNLDAINTVPKGALRRKICTLSAAKLADVKMAILDALDLK